MTDETVYIDANEPDDVIAKVINEVRDRTDFETEIKGLETADFVFKDIAIERKESDDMRSSIVDRRLSEQTDRMAADFEHGYVIVEGDPYTSEYSDLDSNSIVGTYASTVAKKDLKTLNVDSKDSTAYAIAKICQYHEDDSYDATQQMLKRSSVESEDVFVAMLSCIKGISGEKAREISEMFESMAQMCSLAVYEQNKLKEEYLKTVDGIGDGLSERIVENLTEA